MPRRKPGVQRFIPSEFGFDYTLAPKGTCALLDWKQGLQGISHVSRPLNPVNPKLFELPASRFGARHPLANYFATLVDRFSGTFRSAFLRVVTVWVRIPLILCCRSAGRRQQR
jgi:hypothetical protein